MPKYGAAFLDHAEYYAAIAPNPDMWYILDLGVAHPNDRMFFNTPTELAEAVLWAVTVSGGKPRQMVVTIEPREGNVQSWMTQ